MCRFRLKSRERKTKLKFKAVPNKVQSFIADFRRPSGASKESTVYNIISAATNAESASAGNISFRSSSSISSNNVAHEDAPSGARHIRGGCGLRQGQHRTPGAPRFIVNLCTYDHPYPTSIIFWKTLKIYRANFIRIAIFSGDMTMNLHLRPLQHQIQRKRPRRRRRPRGRHRSRCRSSAPRRPGRGGAWTPRRCGSRPQTQSREVNTDV